MGACRRPLERLRLAELGDELAAKLPDVRWRWRHRVKQIAIGAPALPYAESKRQLQTGDVVFFAGRDLLGSIIRFFTRSCTSHCAVIVRDPDAELRRLHPLRRLDLLRQADRGAGAGDW